MEVGELKLEEFTQSEHAHGQRNRTYQVKPVEEAKLRILREIQYGLRVGLIIFGTQEPPQM